MLAGVKHFANRLCGSGPLRVASFERVIEGRRNPARGTHQAESFDGVLRRMTGGAAIYRGGLSLLGQPHSCELVDGQRRYLPDGIAPEIEMCLYSLTDGAVAGADGLVYCPRTRSAVEEAMRSWIQPISRHPLLSAPRFPAPKRLAGRVLSIAALDAEGFYHFLLESLPRLWLGGDFLPGTNWILANGRPGSFQEKWLAQAGIGADRVIWLDGLSSFRCDQLAFASCPSGDQQPNLAAIRAVRELLRAEPPARPGTERIWISRADAASRRPAWETALLRQLGGFTSICLSRQSPAEQIEVMRRAAVVAGPHGAGFSNLIFCAPGTKVVEIFPDRFWVPLYSRLAEVCGLKPAWATTDFESPQPAPGLSDAINAFVA